MYITLFDENVYFPKMSAFSVRTCDNITSPNIGGTDAWAVPHLKFWGDRPPSPLRSPPMAASLSLRLWTVQSCWGTIYCWGTSLGDGALTSGAGARAPALATGLAECVSSVSSAEG